ncbi:cupredoxin domain-containing protein [Halococcus sediminicola]|uniref:cupredoxin domain-containing protein n=1 Tax=Halococcus sediminicola TaxID=1264579 RepID=UPI0006792698|nr:cupredoxin domain-containing protein [Halococcus sediminicola]
MKGHDFDRRTVLKGGVASLVAAAGLAGCTGGAQTGGNDSGANGSSTDGSGSNGSANGSGSGDRKVRVVLKEWRVKPDAKSVPAGNVTFDAVNEGHEVHELVVRQRNDDGAYEKLDEVDDIAKGTSKKLRTKLDPGTYELACLIVEEEEGETEDHYKLGMHETIEATKQG